jgi:hypothetical protein
VVVLCPRVDVVEAREAGRAKRAYGSGMTADAIVARADEALM